MKNLLIILLLSISQITSADDLSDFEVLGMSIDDNLLNFITEDEILDEIDKRKTLNRYSHLKEPNKFLEITVPKQENNLYDGSEVFIKNTIPRDNTIHGIRGYRYYIEDFDACIKKRNQIAEILTNFFPDAKTGSLITEDKNKITDNFSIGNSERIIDVNCIDLEEAYRLKHNFKEGLEFVIRNKEFSNWAMGYK
ncbi:hypothetical protein N9I91_02325 [Candidatus Pseudothioglobus singularis]|nr:hypothetical protein [Candidatus Pseudothioglobus singularis]